MGPVIRSEVLALNGHPKGSGFVRFEDAVTCEKAIGKYINVVLNESDSNITCFDRQISWLYVWWTPFGYSTR